MPVRRPGGGIVECLVSVHAAAGLHRVVAARVACIVEKQVCDESVMSPRMQKKRCEIIYRKMVVSCQTNLFVKQFEGCRTSFMGGEVLAGFEGVLE